MILLAGKEERVPRRSTIAVPKFARELGVALFPRANPLGPYAGGRVVPEGLVVVAQSKEQMARDGLGARGLRRPPLSKVAREPKPEVLLSDTSQPTQLEHSGAALAWPVSGRVKCRPR